MQQDYWAKKRETRMLIATNIAIKLQTFFGVACLVFALLNVRQAWLGKSYLVLSPRFERLANYFQWTIVPFAAVELFLLFRQATPSTRLAMGIIAFCVLIGLASKRWASSENSLRKES
jgi:hypothetical protein